MSKLPLTALFALPLALGLAACGGASEASGDTEDALERAGVKTHARNVEHPAGLVVTDSHVYFSANHFVASGEPELDQQFAYWQGKYSRVALGGGRREKVSDAGLTRVRMAGKKLFVATGSSCWISVMDTSEAEPSQKGIYTDEDCTGEGGGEPAGFEVTDDKFAVVREGGELMVGKHDGTGMRKVGEFKFADYAGFISQTALADDHVFVITHKNFTDSRTNRVLPQTIFSLPLSGGTPKTVLEFPAADALAENLISDGKNLYFTQGKKVMALKSGASEATMLDDDFGGVYDLAADGKNVYVADGKRGALYAIKDALTAPKHVKLADAKGVTSVVASGERLYYGTHAYAGNKPAGVVASLPIPE